jgi:hypothetical protein
MKPDLYTKAILTLIAFMLVMIGFHQYLSPATAVKAEGPFAGVQFTGTTDDFTMFDPRTGDIWSYTSNGGYSMPPRMEHVRISAPGIPASAVGWYSKK